MVLQALRREETEARAVEAVKWAEAHSDEWLAIAKGWVLAAAKLQEFEARAEAFLHKASGSGAPLPLCEFIGSGAQVEVPGATLEIVMRAAIKEQVVTVGELKGAKNVK